MKINFMIALCLFASVAEGKNFFSVPATIKLVYSNIITGTETVIEKRDVSIRYSSNDDNCLLFKDGVISPKASSLCGSYYYGTYVNLNIPTASIEFWTTDLVPSHLLASWRRIIQNSSPLKITSYRTERAVFKRQLHDSVASESFHITISLEPETEL